MEETDFDIIVVGGGCAGSISAYVAATAGKNVLVIERGTYSGAKSMTGGRIYSHSLKDIFPDFEREAPLERKITHERISMLDAESNMTIDFTSEQLGKTGEDSYSVLRGPFDQWLAQKAEEAGADYIYGIAVEELLKNDEGHVIGIKADEDEITAHVVIVADGVNSLLSNQATGASIPKTHEMAVGIKEVFELPASQISDRFLCEDNEGAAWLFVGDCTHGTIGGGFLYTNSESISLGLVATISDLEKANTTICQMLDDFKHHKAIAPIIKDAKMVEHSGHMVSEGGFNMLPEYVGNGVLLAGDSAMLCMNLGYMVRGMDLAVASGRMAAEAACDAIDKNNVTVNGLVSYKEKMENSFVIKDMQTFKAWPTTMENWGSLFTQYPIMIKNIFNAMFVVDGAPQKHLRKRILPIIQNQGIFKLLGEVRGVLRSL